MPKFGMSSLEQLSTCDYRLQEILNEVVKYYDIKVLVGHRDEATQNEMYRLGRSKLKWPNGKHNTYPSKAVDVTPYPVPKNWGALSKNDTLAERDKAWKERLKFYELKALIFYIAAQKGYKIRYGGDWDNDYDYTDQSFDDLVHFEIVE